MNDVMITVLTPTYNRKDTLKRLYESLTAQSSKYFQWLIIDDGSTDGTFDFFSKINCKSFIIDCYRKENGGKHTALNFSHPYIKGELVVIVDSDDYLLPDAIATISSEWKKFKGRDDICGLSYFKGFADGTHLSVDANEDFYIDDDISYRVNNPRIKGDRCEVVRTDLFIAYPFPEYDGEKFISEDMLWNRLAYKYKTVYRNKLLYICEYLDGGLSASGRKLRLQCGRGMAAVTKTYLISRVRLTRRIKATWLYICYSKCAGDNSREIIHNSGQVLLTVLNYPFGWLLFHYWKNKYLRK